MAMRDQQHWLESDLVADEWLMGSWTCSRWAHAPLRNRCAKAAPFGFRMTRR